LAFHCYATVPLLPIMLTTDVSHVFYFPCPRGTTRKTDTKNDRVNQLTDWLAQL